MYGKTHIVGAILDSPPIGRISDLTLDPPPLERQKYGKTHVVGGVKSGWVILQSIGEISDLTLDPPLLERQKYGKTHVVGAVAVLWIEFGRKQYARSPMHYPMDYACNINSWSGSSTLD